MKTIISSIGTAALLCFFNVSSVLANNYYVDPATGAIGNDGSANSPWNTLEAVTGVKTLSGGDTVFCLAGYHGTVSLNGLNGSSASPLVFMAADGAAPQIKQLSCGTGSHMVVDGFTISPSAVQPYENVEKLVSFGGGATFVTVQNCSLYSSLEALSWTMDEWDFENAAYKLCSYAFYHDGKNCTVRNNYIAYTQYGIIQPHNSATDMLIEYNTIDHFAEDGMRILGHNAIVRYNVVKNAYVINYRHTDGLQSWAVPLDGTASCKGVKVIGNQFYNWTGEKHEWNDYMMPVGCHDGMFEGWLVENNLCVTNGWVGIQLLGAIACTLVNNTVITIPGGDQPPWIKIDNHKNGTSSTGCIIRNNLATDIVVGTGVTADHNIGSAMAKVLVNDYNNWDFTLKPGYTYAIDAGTAETAPATDILGTPRPQGAGVDLGCYEYAATGVRPAGYADPRAPLREVKIGPLPVTAASMVSFSAIRPGVVTLTLHTQDGTEVARRSLDAQAGTNAIPFPGADLAGGLYYYRVMLDGKEAAQGPVVVQ